MLQRKNSGLLAGMWEFYHIDGILDAGQAVSYIAREGFEPVSIEREIPYTHVFSHVEWRMRAYFIECRKKNAITCRYADLLEPELDKIEAEMKQWKQQDEDVLTYALFPQVATDFFKYREAQQKKVDATVADTKNGAYPV